MRISQLVAQLESEGYAPATVRAYLDRGRFERAGKGLIRLKERRGGRRRMSLANADQVVVLNGCRIGINRDRRAAVLGCQLGSAEWQRLVEFAFQQGVLPEGWERGPDGRVDLVRSLYRSEGSWRSCRSRHVGEALFRLAQEYGLLSDSPEAVTTAPPGAPAGNHDPAALADGRPRTTEKTPNPDRGSGGLLLEREEEATVRFG